MEILSALGLAAPAGLTAPLVLRRRAAALATAPR